MRRSDLGSPFRGIRSPISSPALLSLSDAEAADDYWGELREIALARAEAFRLIMSDRAALSHGTAARWHGMPLPARLEKDLRVHISTSTRQARPRRAGVVAHFAPRDLVTAVERDGLRVTSPVQTWCALASVLTVDELVALGDHLVRRRSPDATLEQLRTAVRRSAGRHGSPRLREAVELIRPRTDSVRESSVRLALVAAGLPEPEVNAPLHDRYGMFIRHGDLAYPRYRVLVEYDGEQHRLDDLQYLRDKEQLERLEAAGWRVIHVLRHHADDLHEAVARVRQALMDAGWHP